MTELIISVVSAIIVAIVTGFMTYFKKQAKDYKRLLAEQKEENYRKQIHEEIAPLEKDLGELRVHLQKLENAEEERLKIIQGQYKFRLIHLCKVYIRQQYITEDQFEQLSEFYKVYTALGGNGQAAEFYQKVLNLPVHD